jgi:hypothetical protein
MEIKSKMDGSMRRDASDSSTNFTIFVVLGHKGSLVISFSINRPQGLVERQAFSHPCPTPSHSCFLRGVGVFHGVRE